MIATILPSSPTFHAVAYNEAKIAQGKAVLLEIKNFGEIDILGYSSPNELTQYLLQYSANNSRIQQPQFHLAISCKGHEYTEEQLVEFAHKYLEEMGYGDQEQPLLIYGHRDTDNTHIHIVTSRVDPRGKKINDSNERRKSQKAIDKIMKTDLKAKAEKDIQDALQFVFRSTTQFKAVMEAMNYECFEKEGTIYVKKGGMIQAKVETLMIAEKAELNRSGYQADVAEYAKWRSIFKKYRDTNTNRAGLERDLRKMFGLSLVFFGKKDSPYGYVVVDFNKKKAYEGGRILGLKELLDFRTPEQHMEEIEEYINNTFDQNAGITTKELNKKLKGLGAYVSKYTIKFGNIKKAMADSHRALLERNNKIAWRTGFKPQTVQERDLLCKLTGFNYPDLIPITPPSNGKYYCKDHKELSEIFNIDNPKERLMSFSNAGFRIITHEGGVYAYRAETQSLTELSKAGFDKSQYGTLIPYGRSSLSAIHGSHLDTRPKSENSRKTVSTSVKRTHDGSHYANREWEVGKQGRDRDDMDENTGMAY